MRLFHELHQQLILLCNHLSCSLRPPATPLSNFDDLRGSSQWKTKGKIEIDFSRLADRPRDDLVVHQAEI